MVSGVAIPLGGFLEDLRLATQFATEHRHDTRDWENLGHLDTLYDEMKELRRDEAQFRQRLGDEAFESLWNFVLQRAQEQLLGRPAITPFDLAKMYNLFGRAYGTHSTEMWNEMFASSPLRIRLSELPQVEGTSTSWKQEIDRKLRAFQKQWGRIVNPLLVPVALEVVIRPPPASRQNNLHDLDNVLRTYLIPRVVDILKPLSHHAFTVNEDAMQRAAETDPQFAKWRSRFRKPPVSTKLGFTRYEAWRLPPSDEGSDGFVSVAIVSDMTGHEDILGQVDEWVEKWREVPSLGW